MNVAGVQIPPSPPKERTGLYVRFFLFDKGGFEPSVIHYLYHVPNAGFARFQDDREDPFPRHDAVAGLLPDGAVGMTFLSDLCHFAEGGADAKLRADRQRGEIDAMLRGDIGWQYAFGDTDAASRHSLSMASNESFGVRGTPIAKSAALVELGLDWAIGIGKQLSLSYQGQYAAKQQQHGVKAKLEVRF